jgi:GT2 family glycosyltransferase
MIAAWKSAFEYGEFDYFLWLNDDTIMDKDALMVLLETDEIVRRQNELRLITAACRSSETSIDFSYGGRTDLGKVIPNGEIQECKYINGNLVLIPKTLFSKLGYLSDIYTHGIGDNDYGLRCIVAGGKCYTTSRYIAVCPPNEGIPGWCNPTVSLRKRWQLLHSPRGLNIREYNQFRKRFWGKKWMLFAVKAYIKTIIPGIYNGISVKNKESNNNE